MATLAVNTDYRKAFVAAWHYVQALDHLALLLYILFTISVLLTNGSNLATLAQVL